MTNETGVSREGWGDRRTGHGILQTNCHGNTPWQNGKRMLHEAVKPCAESRRRRRRLSSECGEITMLSSTTKPLELPVSFPQSGVEQSRGVLSCSSSPFSSDFSLDHFLLLLLLADALSDLCLYRQRSWIDHHLLAGLRTQDRSLLFEDSASSPTSSPTRYRFSACTDRELGSSSSSSSLPDSGLKLGPVDILLRFFSRPFPRPRPRRRVIGSLPIQTESCDRPLPRRICPILLVLSPRRSPPLSLSIISSS